VYYGNEHRANWAGRKCFAFAARPCNLGGVNYFMPWGLLPEGRVDVYLTKGGDTVSAYEIILAVVLLSRFVYDVWKDNFKTKK